MTALAEKTLGQESQAWHEHELRQRKYDVHHDTHSIVLIFCDASWPDPTVTREPGWARLSDVAQPLMDTIIAATIRRAARSFGRWRRGSKWAERSSRTLTRSNRSCGPPHPHSAQ